VEGADVTQPTLGPRIRAARLGYGYAPRHGCFARISDADGGNFRIELCPVNAVPSKKSRGGYRVWWENDPGVLDMIPWLRNVRRIKRYVCVVVDEHGTILRSET
jgi:hypothetical protein